MQRSRRDEGFTLVEMAIALAVATILLVLIGDILFRSTSSADYIVQGSNATATMHRALDRIRGELHRAAPEVVNVNPGSTVNDSFTLQTAGPFSGTTRWGAEDNLGTWHEDWSARYSVVQGDLVRESLNGLDVVQGAPEIVARDVDDPISDDKGFEVTRNGPVVGLKLRVRKTFSDGVQHTEELTTSVLVKNSQS